MKGIRLPRFVPGFIASAGRLAAGAIADAAYPLHCSGCDAWMSDREEGHLCRRCRDRLEVLTGDVCPRCGRPLARYVVAEDGCAFCARESFAFKGVVAALLYDDVSRPIIHRFKYGRDLYLRVTLAELMCDAIRRRGLDGKIDLVTAVPLHWMRYAARGYNQSHLLAHQVARELKVPFASRLLRRVRNTPSQTSLARPQRQRNVTGAFACRRRAAGYRRVLLIDDVMTTGSTVSACAEALKRAGVREVHVAVVARTPD